MAKHCDCSSSLCSIQLHTHTHTRTLYAEIPNPWQRVQLKIGRMHRSNTYIPLGQGGVPRVRRPGTARKQVFLPPAPFPPCGRAQGFSGRDPGSVRREGRSSRQGHCSPVLACTDLTITKHVLCLLGAKVHQGGEALNERGPQLIRRPGAAEIRRDARALAQDLLQRLLEVIIDPQSRGQALRDQHRRAHGRDGVGLLGALQMGRRAVHGLGQHQSAALVHGGDHPESPDQWGPAVGDDVRPSVRSDHDVVLRGSVGEFVHEAVDQLVVVRDVRELLGDLLAAFQKESVRHAQNVGFVHNGHVRRAALVAAAAAGQRESKPRDAEACLLGDVALRHDDLPLAHNLIGVALLANVQALSVLPHHHHVHIAAPGLCVHRCGHHRPDISVELALLPQLEDWGHVAGWGLRGSRSRPEQRPVAGLELCDGLIGNGLASALECGVASLKVNGVEGDGGLVLDDIQHPLAPRHDVFPNPVPRDDGHIETGPQCLWGQQQ
mmetsp:Transcript_6302/g.11769  ORF Transcript_6302/g.11769 Transcript_6302/m.11769 type:complete len:493 (-) Transcript_6302:55-1533(-)